MKGHFKLAFWLSLSGTVSWILFLALVLAGVMDSIPPILSWFLGELLNALYLAGFASYFIGFGLWNTIKLSFCGFMNLGDTISGGFSGISEILSPSPGVYKKGSFDANLATVSDVFGLIGILLKIFAFLLWLTCFFLLTFVTYLITYMAASADISE